MKKIFYATCITAISLLSLHAQAQNDPGAVAGDTGTVTFNYRGNTVTYITVRADDGKIWLQQNLGSASRATSATDTTSYGHLFQWGRWDDGHQLRNSTTTLATTLSANNPSGIGAGSTSFYNGNNPNDWWSAGSGTDTWTNAPASASNGTDPCAAIGPGWHLPSQPEWANAITLEGITNVATGFTSNLKLPAAGMREANLGGLLNVGLYGNYWANTPSGIYAKDITILDNGINNNDDALRSYGFSIRCMTTCTGVFAPQSINGADTVCPKSAQTYTIPAVNNTIGYMWTVPSDWTITGLVNGISISVITGTTSGNITAKAMNNCDTSDSVILTVTVRPEPDPVITANGNTLSTGSFVAYQWLFNEVTVPGAQNQTYTPTLSGSYKVRVVDANGCVDTSAVYNHTVVGIDEVIMGGTTLLYPNPANDVLNINSKEKVDLSIYSIDGRLLAQYRQTIQAHIQTIPAGIYMVRLHDSKGKLLKIEKLTIIRD